MVARTADALFVGDAKYKNLADRSAPNADLYQLLAYATALDLPGGTLIYAQDKAEPHMFAVRLCWQAAVSGCAGHFTPA